MQSNKLVIKIESGYFGGYNVVECGKTPSNKNFKNLIASGFNSAQAAIDYARLARYDNNLAPEYAFTAEQKSKLQEINACVDDNYCTWLGFVECVLASGGIQGLLEKINSNMKIQEIVNCYI